MAYFDLDTLNDSDATLEDYAATAADLVQRWAPVPDPEPADYPARAARAERLVLNYLMQTAGGVLTGKSISGVTSKSFASDAGVRSIVARTMGSYYHGTRSVRIV